MLFRPTAEADLGRVLACITDEPISWATPDRYRAHLAAGSYRTDRTWIAEQGGQILARAVWWSDPAAEHPLALDCVWVRESVADRTGLAAELIATAHRAFRAQGATEVPEYHIFLPNGWSGVPAVAKALYWRRDAAGQAGLTEELERLQYEWTSATAVPVPSGRLTLRAEPDDEVFLAAFRRVAEGSLDANTRKGVSSVGADRQARADMGIYLSMPGERGWWRLAYDAGGALAGLAIPSANEGGPVVGYLGVVPELRGRRYVDDLLASITRHHIEAGAQRIRADTDRTNLPMAAAFDRAGYVNYGIRLVLSSEG